jgi:hypothetical protein
MHNCSSSSLNNTNHTAHHPKRPQLAHYQESHCCNKATPWEGCVPCQEMGGEEAGASRAGEAK